MRHHIYDELALVAPNIAFTATKERDHSFRWDGDGPDPELDAMYAHDVTVSAMAIIAGQLLTGEAHLGGSYYEPTENVGDVHGYLIQMLDEAAMELLKQIHNDAPLAEQLRQARRSIKLESQREYEGQ